MVWFILAHIFRILVAFISIRRLSDLEKDLEILVLRHQLAILKRKSNKPVKPNQIEKMTLAILTAKLQQVTQQGRQLVWKLDDRENTFYFLIHDNDRKFSKAFDHVFESEGFRIIHTPFHAPNANAY